MRVSETLDTFEAADLQDVGSNAIIHSTFHPAMKSFPKSNGTFTPTSVLLSISKPAELNSSTARSTR